MCLKYYLVVSPWRWQHFLKKKNVDKKIENKIQLLDMLIISKVDDFSNALFEEKTCNSFIPLSCNIGLLKTLSPSYK